MNRRPILLLLSLVVGSGLIVGRVASPAWADIIVPALDSSQNTNAYSSATPDKLTDNSGLDTPVNTGDTLAQAQAAIHANTGVFESWVTNAAAPDYYATSPSPVFVWDLGGDWFVDNVVLWQYQNNGGGDNRVGNHARTFELRFNTEAEGAAAFGGPATTFNMAPVLTGEVNVAQTFTLGGATARYVEMTVTDNHYGDPDGFGVHPTIGGDRVGLGEVRFDVSVIPEPTTWLMLMSLGGCIGLLGWWRRRHA